MVQNKALWCSCPNMVVWYSNPPHLHSYTI